MAKDYIAKLEDLIAAKDAEGLFEQVRRTDDDELLRQTSWDMIPVVCTMFTQNIAEEYPAFLYVCSELLQKIARCSNAKETLISLLEHAETFKDECKYTALLKALAITLLKLPLHKHRFLDLALPPIVAYIESLPVPSEYGLEGNEVKLLDSDPLVVKLGNSITDLLGFISDIAHKLLQLEENCTKSKKLLAISLIRLLGHPLAFLDLETASQPKGHAEEIVKLLVKLVPNMYQIHCWAKVEHEERDLEELKGVPLLGVCCLFYLVICKQIAIEELPLVMHPAYVLHMHGPALEKALTQPNVLAVLKGLELFTALLMRLNNQSMEYSPEDQEGCHKLPNKLIDIMVFNQTKSIRTAALETLKLYIQKMCTCGRYWLFLRMLHELTHSGAQGLFIGFLKDEISSQLSASEPAKEFTTETWLRKIFARVFILPEGAETDLLEASDKVMAALNLMRFMLLRDKGNINLTGVWNMVADLERDYFFFLYKGLQLSRVHYELELKNKTESLKESKKLDKEKREPRVEVLVSGKRLSEATAEQELDVLKSALRTFDMMDCVLGHVREIINSREKEQKACASSL